MFLLLPTISQPYYGLILYIWTNEALEGFLGIQGYWPKTLRDMGYFCKYIKGYVILGSILGIWRYNAFRVLGIDMDIDIEILFLCRL